MVENFFKIKQNKAKKDILTIFNENKIPVDDKTTKFEFLTQEELKDLSENLTEEELKYLIENFSKKEIQLFADVPEMLKILIKNKKASKELEKLLKKN